MNDPPDLDYSLRERRASQVVIFSVIIFVNAGLPTLVFYLLKHLTSAVPIVIYAVVSAVFALGLIQLPLRLFMLLRKQGERSPLPADQSGAFAVQKENASWYERIDVFQWEFTGCTGFTAIFFIISCSSNGDQGYFPFLVLAPSLLVAQVGIQVLGASLLHLVGFRLPFRFGSVAKGDIIRPAPYYIWEDIVAVDGGGGAAFRARFDARYRASPPFQRMLCELGLLMGAGAVALLAMELGLTFSGASQDVVYGTSMAIAVIWAGVGASVAIVYCKWALRREKAWFAAQALQGADETDSIKSDSVNKGGIGSTSQIPVLVQDR